MGQDCRMLSAEASRFGLISKASRCLARDASHFVRLKMRLAEIVGDGAFSRTM